jgi:integrase
MRTERNKDGSWNVWMSRTEYAELPRAAHSMQAEVAIRLMGDCGLRVAETLDVTAGDVSRMSDGRHYQLEVRAGKDTTGEYEQGKQRETWMPRDVEVLVNRFQQQAGRDIDEPLIDRKKRTVQHWVERAAEGAADETGDSDYLRVSSHDLRRCWANHLLVEEGVSPRIMMALGGWSSYDAIEPYLAAPTEGNIIENMSAADL